MKQLAIATACIALLTIACKKENDTPAFKPEGFWRGNAYLYHAAVLNRTNGTAKLYFVIPGIDTSKAQTKLEGSYTMDRGKYFAIFPNVTDTFYLESTSTSATQMSGLVLWSTEGQAVPFEFFKQ